MTPHKQRLQERNERIIKRWWAGWEWASIASEAGTSVRTCQNVVTAFKQMQERERNGDS